MRRVLRIGLRTNLRNKVNKKFIKSKYFQFATHLNQNPRKKMRFLQNLKKFKSLRWVKLNKGNLKIKLTIRNQLCLFHRSTGFTALLTNFSNTNLRLHPKRATTRESTSSRKGKILLRRRQEPRLLTRWAWKMQGLSYLRARMTTWFSRIVILNPRLR